MTAPTMALTGTVHAGPVLDAWALYRRSQQVPVPANPGDLIEARDVLFRLAEPFASGREPMGEADVDAIEDAADRLAATVEWHCGEQAAAYVSGEEGGEQ
jgi:hypothetical protein